MTSDLPIVGIGASAGGVEALEQFFRAVPADHGMAFVVVTHLSPSHESMLAEILGRAARMRVFNATDGEVVQPQQVYVLPSSATLTIREGRLRLHRTGLPITSGPRSTSFSSRSPRIKKSVRSALCSRAVAATAPLASRRSRNVAG
jgi:two-component system CheB/CheR fusion protein